IATFIPSFIWEDKPPTTQSLIGQWLTGIDVMTIPPSIFGDAYLNFGVVGFTIFILFGFLISMMDNINDKYIRLAMYSIVFVLVFHFVRGAFVNPLVALVFVYLGVFASKKIIQPTIVKVV
ncbi:O-antigen polysaccharide polymerase Wzy, partial [Vibrio parahaemolyticus]